MKKFTKEQVAVLIETAYLHGMYDWKMAKKGSGKQYQVMKDWMDGKTAGKIFEEYMYKG